MAEAIGHISSLTGKVTITLESGETVVAQQGMAVSLHDTIATGADSKIEIDFTDGSTFAMSPGSVMEVEKFAYDVNGSDNGFIIDFTKGAFEFVAGEIAHLFGDGMQVETPAGTLGVRGTAGAAIQDPATGEWTFMLLKDPSGHLGKIALINAGGEVLLDEWMEASVLRGGETPTTPHTLSTEDVRTIFGATTGMIQDLRQQNPIHNGEQGNNVDPTDAHPQAAESGGIGTALDLEGNALDQVGAGLESIEAAVPVLSLVVDLGQASGAAGVLGNDEALEGLYDQIFESPLIQMPVLQDEAPVAVSYDGTSGSEFITSNAGSQILNGLDGDDFLNGGAGNDVLDGGNGTDWADYSLQTTDHGVNVELWSSTAYDDGTGGTDTLVSIENVNGTQYADVIDGNGAGVNRLSGNDGDDTIRGGINDFITGGAGNDEIYAAMPTTGQIQGNGGWDTWHVTETGSTAIDLSTANVSGIDFIDLGTSTNGSLTLTLADLLDVNENNFLAVFGDADNTVTSIGQGWTLTGTTDLDGHGIMNVYTSAGAELLVDPNLIVNLS